MARFQINYQVTEIGDGTAVKRTPVKGSVIYSASVIGKAIDAARVNLIADPEIASFVITSAKEV